MNSMAIDRRRLIGGGAALLACAPLALPLSGQAAARSRYVSAARGKDGNYQIVFLSQDGVVERTVPLSGRGHDIALSPDGRTAVAFARRPGTFGVAIDVAGRKAPEIFTATAGHHFYGHGVFSTDGRLLYATENVYDDARGVLGIYDIGAGYKRIGEYATHGVGPHEVLMMADGVTLCVANGGIETHPDAGRAKLNLDTMAPSVAFIDSRTGGLKSLHALSAGLHQLSLRHMCGDASGRVWFGGQWEGGVDDTPWLIGNVAIDRQIALAEPPAFSGKELKGYIGSMASSADGRIVAASAPRAGRVLYFEAASGRLVGEASIADGCGVAPAGGERMALTSGEGIFEVSSPGAKVGHESRTEGISFDNHLRRIA